jgi:hypothetical protein
LGDSLQLWLLPQPCNRLRSGEVANSARRTPNGSAVATQATSSSTRRRFSPKPIMTSPSITSVAVERLFHLFTNSS